MKKLFTFLMVLTMTMVVFGQDKPIEPVYYYPGETNGMDRSSWVGPAASNYFGDAFDPDDIVLTRLNSYMTPSVGDTITKIKFKWLSEWEGTNYGRNINIQIYTGGSIDWITVATDTADYSLRGWRTTDIDQYMGTLVYEQPYTCTESGEQVVELETPYVVTGNEGEIWFGIKNVSSTKTTLFYNYDAEPGEHWGTTLWRYDYNGERVLRCIIGTYEQDESQLAARLLNIQAYIADGEDYVPQCDMRTMIFDPEQPEEQVRITELEMYPWSDLDFYGGFWNSSIDSAYGLYFVSLYAVVGTDTLWFQQEDDYTQGESYTLEYLRGFFPSGTLVPHDSLEFYGLTMPFQLCYDVRYQSDASYNSYDPNLENNHYCVTVKEAGDDESIREISNTLGVTPNPARTYIKVDNAAGAQITIYNIAGQEVMSVASANANETLNVSNLNAGLYIVRVVNGNEVSTAKVSIVR